MTLVNRIIPKKAVSYFLFGPRGTGKSTWLLGKYPQAARIDLLDGEAYRQYLAKPERLSAFVEAHLEQGPIIIDEIQRVPELLPMVHQLMEKYPQVQFILTGSSARKLRRSETDLLAGRALKYHMHPFMACELADRFSLEASLLLGMVPLVRSAQNPSLALKNYISLYMEEEVKAEGIIRRVDHFFRFLESISFSHGNVLNMSEAARDSQVKRSTVSSYVSILEDLLIASRVPVFTKRAKRVTISHSKFYFFDCGVYGSLRPSGPLDRPELQSGAALEGLVYQHLRAWIDYGELDAKIYFWRTKSGSEVDFILYGKDLFWALEVKNSASIRSKELRPLNTFLEDYPECSGIFLYRGKEKLKLGGITCMPVEEFLSGLRPGNPLLPSLPGPG